MTNYSLILRTSREWLQASIRLRTSLDKKMAEFERRRSVKHSDSTNTYLACWPIRFWFPPAESKTHSNKFREIAFLESTCSQPTSLRHAKSRNIALDFACVPKCLTHNAPKWFDHTHAWVERNRRNSHRYHPLIHRAIENAEDWPDSEHS